MENASKALIIAASVLVAILIVSMGIMIFSKAQSAGDTSGLDATEISLFNSKFERYNNNQLGSQVKSLISYAISNANTNKDDPVMLPSVSLQKELKDGNPVFYSGSPATGGESASGDKNATYIDYLGKMRNAIISTHTYVIKLDYGSSGIINKIDIWWE